MIDHVWTVVCSRAVIDRDSNNVSLQNVIEQFTITEEPRPEAVIPIRMDVVTLWARADLDVPDRGRMRLTLRSPSGVEVRQAELEIDLTEFKRHRARARFERMPASEPGRHVFQVELQNDEEGQWLQVAAIPVEVIFRPPEPAEAQDEAE